MQGAGQGEGGEDSGGEEESGGVRNAGDWDHSAVPNQGAAHPRHRSHPWCALWQTVMRLLV